MPKLIYANERADGWIEYKIQVNQYSHMTGKTTMGMKYVEKLVKKYTERSTGFINRHLQIRNMDK